VDCREQLGPTPAVFQPPRRLLLVACLAFACSEPVAPPSSPIPPASAARGLVYVVPDALGRRLVVLAQPDGSTPVVADTLDVSSYGPVVSRDGDRLASMLCRFDSGDGWYHCEVTVTDTAGNALVTHEPCGGKYMEPSPYAPSMAWLPDGAHLAIQCAKLGLVVLNASLGCAGCTIYSVYPSQIGAVQWSPSGKWILDGNVVISSDTSDHQIHPLPSGASGFGWSLDDRVLVGTATTVGLWQLGSTAITPVLTAAVRHASYSPDGKLLLVIDSMGLRILGAAKHNLSGAIPRVTWAAWRP